MGDLKASPLHLISAIINTPRFHRDLSECPTEVTERCVHLLTTLGRSREVAIQTNYEVMEFLGHAISPFDDIGYMRVSRYFVQELLRVVGPQHKLWGAISYVMLSAVPDLSEASQQMVWRQLNARFFEVLLDSGVISNEEERRLKTKSVKGEVDAEPDLSFDDESEHDQSETRTPATQSVSAPTQAQQGGDPQESSNSDELPEDSSASESDETDKAVSLLGGGHPELFTQRRLKRSPYPIQSKPSATSGLSDISDAQRSTSDREEVASQVITEDKPRAQEVMADTQSLQNTEQATPPGQVGEAAEVAEEITEKIESSAEVERQEQSAQQSEQVERPEDRPPVEEVEQSAIVGRSVRTHVRSAFGRRT